VRPPPSRRTRLLRAGAVGAAVLAIALALVLVLVGTSDPGADGVLVILGVVELAALSATARQTDQRSEAMGRLLSRTAAGLRQEGGGGGQSGQNSLRP
jgi:hypothetical protein